MPDHTLLEQMMQILLRRYQLCRKKKQTDIPKGKGKYLLQKEK